MEQTRDIGRTNTFQETNSVLKRFGTTVHDSRMICLNFIEEGLSNKSEDDILVGLVRKSNEGIPGGRTATCGVIGDREFVINALDSAQAAKLRISRFEREGITIDSIAVEIGKRFNVAADQLKKRHRNNAVSDARKAFAFAADNEYHAPHRIIAADLTVGSTAISEMARKEKLIMVERGIGN